MQNSKDFGKKEGQVIQVNEGELKKHVSEIVRESVEDTLNSLLEAELDCERPERRDLAAENRQLWKDNAALREKVGRLEVEAHKLSELGSYRAQTGQTA